MKCAANIGLMCRVISTAWLLVVGAANPSFGQNAPAAATSTNAPAGGIDISSLLAKEAKDEFAISADYFRPEGDITVPVNFNVPGQPKEVINPGISGDFFGSTLSYSRGDTWFVDLSYSEGSYSKNDSVPITRAGSEGVSVSRDENWYQADVRYAFPWLRGKRLSAYVRAGISYMPATVHVDTIGLPTEVINETDKFNDLTGNLGFGVGYALFKNSRWAISLQLEGDGLYGDRSQSVSENEAFASGFVNGSPSFGSPVSASTHLDNDLWGGSTRGTIRIQYYLGKARLARLFLDGGMGADYLAVDYSKYGFGSPGELFWGPYVKLGLRVSF